MEMKTMKTITITEKELKDMIREEARALIVSMIKTKEITVDTKIYTRTTILAGHDKEVVTGVDAGRGILVLNPTNF